jgi:HD superfamily phosphohydrolase
MNSNYLHYYDPLYEVLLFGDIPKQGSVRSIFRAGASQIELKKSILPFIRCPEVSRLNWLNQAGLLHLIFPSGTHSRFAHSLGSLHLGSIALNSVTVTIKNGSRSETNTLFSHLRDLDWLEEFVVALFLHDLGHYPFSHTLEKNLGLRNILNGDFVSHEEVACQLILGEGTIFEAYKKLFESKKEFLAATIFSKYSSFNRNIICYLISSNKKYLECETFDSIKQALINIMHDLISGHYDLDRIDHYRRDSFFTGLGHTFKPYVLLNGLHFIIKEGDSKPIELHNKDSEGQISTLLFIRDQLHEYCFGDLRNISLGAMLNTALTLHLESIDKNNRYEKALSILTITDEDLINLLMQSANSKSREIINDIRAAHPYPCIASFSNDQNGKESKEIIGDICNKNKSIVIGFSKYFDKKIKPWLIDSSSVRDRSKGYVFSKDMEHAEIFEILSKANVVGVGSPTQEEQDSFFAVA